MFRNRRQCNRQSSICLLARYAAWLCRAALHGTNEYIATHRGRWSCSLSSSFEIHSERTSDESSSKLAKHSPDLAEKVHRNKNHYLIRTVASRSPVALREGRSARSCSWLFLTKISQSSAIIRRKHELGPPYFISLKLFLSHPQHWIFLRTHDTMR